MIEEIKKQLRLESITQTLDTSGNTTSVKLVLSDATELSMWSLGTLQFDNSWQICAEPNVYWAIAQTTDLHSTVYSMGRPSQMTEPQLKMWKIHIDTVHSDEHLDAVLNLLWRWSRLNKMVVVEEFYQSLQLVSTETAVVLVGMADDPRWDEAKNIVGWTKDFKYTLCPRWKQPANPHGISAQILTPLQIDLPKSFISGGSDGVVTISGKLELGNMEPVIQAYTKLAASFRHNGQSVPFVKGE